MPQALHFKLWDVKLIALRHQHLAGNYSLHEVVDILALEGHLARLDVIGHLLMGTGPRNPNRSMFMFESVEGVEEHLRMPAKICRER